MTALIVALVVALVLATAFATTSVALGYELKRCRGQNALPVGICGTQDAVPFLPGGGITICHLPAGHAGWHQEDHGPSGPTYRWKGDRP